MQSLLYNGIVFQTVFWDSEHTILRSKFMSIDKLIKEQIKNPDDFLSAGLSAGFQAKV